VQDSEAGLAGTEVLLQPIPSSFRREPIYRHQYMSILNKLFDFRVLLLLFFCSLLLAQILCSADLLDVFSLLLFSVLAPCSQ
jgi:hypothetical protein